MKVIQIIPTRNDLNETRFQGLSFERNIYGSNDEKFDEGAATEEGKKLDEAGEKPAEEAKKTLKMGKVPEVHKGKKTSIETKVIMDFINRELWLLDCKFDEKFMALEKRVINNEKSIVASKKQLSAANKGKEAMLLFYFRADDDTNGDSDDDDGEFKIFIR